MVIILFMSCIVAASKGFSRDWSPVVVDAIQTHAMVVTVSKSLQSSMMQ